MVLSPICFVLGDTNLIRTYDCFVPSDMQIHLGIVTLAQVITRKLVQMRHQVTNRESKVKVMAGWQGFNRFEQHHESLCIQ